MGSLIQDRRFIIPKTAHVGRIAPQCPQGLSKLDSAARGDHRHRDVVGVRQAHLQVYARKRRMMNRQARRLPGKANHFDGVEAY